MMQPASHYLDCAGREIHCLEWNAAGPRGTVVAWHGLARTARDMDPLAAHLAQQGWRVVCPDTLGRGLSQWSPEPSAEYCLRFYARTAAALFDAMGIRRAHWVGTSMGGAIGTVCASGLFEPSMPARIASLLLNDNAPELAAPAIARIRSYAGSPQAFDTVRALEAYFRQVYAPYGWLPDAQWRALTESSVRRLPDGRVAPHYDPQMVRQFTDHADDYAIWPHYDALRLPVLCLRGVDSDLVLRETVAAMHHRGPGARGLFDAVEVPGCGHAPALNVPAHYALVEGLLARAEAGEASVAAAAAATA